MSRYVPTEAEMLECQWQAFNPAETLEDCLELECSPARTAQRLLKAEAKHNEEETIRVKLAIEKIERIRKHGRKYAPRVWTTTYRG